MNDTQDNLAIHVDSLRKTYRDGWFWRRRLDVLKGLTFDVRRGEIFGLLGPNGAGKTTFIKILLGIVRKASGSATLLGFPAGSRHGRRLVGYLPENLRIPRHHNARTALEYYGQLSGMPRREVRARQDELLETVGLRDRAGDSVAKYSKGMLQRLGLAQALLHDPQLVILDEPTDGLDPVGRAHVRSVMQQLKAQGKTVFVNSHLLQEVELICDRVAILDKGELRYVGPVADITAGQGAEWLKTSNGQPAETALELELAGAEDAIRQAIGERRIEAWEPAGANGVRLVVLAQNQNDVDQCIDELRRRSVSVISLARRRVTLEDAFLAMVAEPAK